MWKLISINKKKWRPVSYTHLEQRQSTACAIREYLQIVIELSGGMSPVRGSLLTGTIGRLSLFNEPMIRRMGEYMSRSYVGNGDVYKRQ